MVRNIVQYAFIGFMLSGIVPISYASPEKEGKEEINVEKKLTKRGAKELEQAHQGNVESIEHIALFYRYGKEGFEKKPSVAIEWYKKAGDKKSNVALYELGVMYEQGEGVEKNEDKAFEYYRSAVEAGGTEPKLLLRLGNMYIERAAEEKKEGIRSIYQAAQDGDIQAMNVVGNWYYHGKYVKKNYKKALEYYQKSAKKGNSDGIYMVAKMLECGRGAKQDYETSFRLYNELAQKGHGDAMYKLGRMYYNGKGVGKINDKEAVKWYEKAIKKKNIRALTALGELYCSGFRYKKNLDKAVKLFKQASDKGDGLGKYYMGVIYNLGIGVEKDKVKADMFYREAVPLLYKLAKEGEERAYLRLGRVYEKGYGGIKKDSEKGLFYYEKAIELGDISAMTYLGSKYYFTKEVIRDPTKGEELLKRAADLGNSTAMINLATIYRGVIHGKSRSKSIELYRKSAKLNNPGAMYMLGEAYRTGDGVELDYTEALNWYKKSSELEFALGIYGLGIMYENGHGTGKDYEKAAKFYIKAAEMGSTNAMKRLSELYYDGKGVSKDYDKGREWFEKSQK